MVEFAGQPQVDLQLTKEAIRASAARLAAHGDPALSYASYKSLLVEAPWLVPPEPLELDAGIEFQRRTDDRYQIADFLRYYDAAFVRNAYRGILKREPDPDGFRQHLAGLRSGACDKVELLKSLRYSPEGKDKKVHVSDLAFAANLRRVYRRSPVLAYVIQWLIGLVRLPCLVRTQWQFEAYTLGQQRRIAEYVNSVSRELMVGSRRLSEAVTKIERNLEELRRASNQGVAAREERSESPFRKDLGSP